jgi:hypothetical protein
MPQPVARTKQTAKAIKAGKVRRRKPLPEDKEDPPGLLMLTVFGLQWLIFIGRLLFKI